MVTITHAFYNVENISLVGFRYIWKLILQGMRNMEIMKVHEILLKVEIVKQFRHTFETENLQIPLPYSSRS